MGSIGESELAAIVDAAGYRDDGSIAVAVVNEDGSIVGQSRGVLADGRSMSTSMRVYGASLTKQFVAMSVARLVQAGRLDPDQAIAPWFPEFPVWADDVTVRHLLHHTSGLPHDDGLLPRMIELGREYRTSDNMIAAMATIPELATLPGEAHLYSNIGYVTLGRIVEKIAGVSLVDHFADTIYRPLGMTQSELWEGPERQPEGANPLDPEKPIPHSLGDGGMWTTAEDLTRWIKAMNADAFGVQELMKSKVSLNDGTLLDYAWAINVVEQNGVEICAHGGGWWGSISQMAWVPAQGTGYIAFTVDGGEPLEKLNAALRERLTA